METADQVKAVRCLGPSSACAAAAAAAVNTEIAAAAAAVPLRGQVTGAG
jgi:hypothetical protein